tara:strand:- start:30 stop:794 length:765 start_codon:yes stop_codon:yes gene_type:complete
MNHNYWTWLVIVGIISASTILYSAGFSATDGLINVPIAHEYIPSEIQFGVSAAYAGSAAKTTDANDRYDIDYKIAYAMNEQNQLAITFPRSNQFIAHFQYTFPKNEIDNQWGIGVRNITDSPFSTWGNGEFLQDNQMSPFVVNTRQIDRFQFSLGFGLGQFQHKQSAYKGLFKYIETFNGLFFGGAYEFDNLTLFGEYDGRDINLGVQIPISKEIDLNIALSELFIDSKTNPNQANAPTRQFTFSLISKGLFKR